LILSVPGRSKVEFSTVTVTAAPGSPITNAKENQQFSAHNSPPSRDLADNYSLVHDVLSILAEDGFVRVDIASFLQKPNISAS
jgi:hypothetical protein